LSNWSLWGKPIAW